MAELLRVVKTSDAPVLMTLVPCILGFEPGYALRIAPIDRPGRQPWRDWPLSVNNIELIETSLRTMVVEGI